MFASGTLAPAGEPFRLNFDQQDSAVAGYAETGFKRPHERHVHFAQDDCIDSHSRFLEFSGDSSLPGFNSIQAGLTDPVRRRHFLQLSRVKPSTARPWENAS